MFFLSLCLKSYLSGDQSLPGLHEAEQYVPYSTLETWHKHVLFWEMYKNGSQPEFSVGDLSSHSLSQTQSVWHSTQILNVQRRPFADEWRPLHTWPARADLTHFPEFTLMHLKNPIQKHNINWEYNLFNSDLLEVHTSTTCIRTPSRTPIGFCDKNVFFTLWSEVNLLPSLKHRRHYTSRQILLSTPNTTS